MIYNWTVTCGEYCKHGKDNKIIMYLGRWRKLGLWGDTLTLYFDNKDDNKVNEEDKYFYINKLKNDKLDNDIYENLIQFLNHILVYLKQTGKIIIEVNKKYFQEENKKK